jgi:hypothetical protein
VVSIVLHEYFTYFCRKVQGGFGADLYRKSTGDVVLGKSAAKDSHPHPRSR